MASVHGIRNMMSIKTWRHLMVSMPTHFPDYILTLTYLVLMGEDPAHGNQPIFKVTRLESC